MWLLGQRAGETSTLLGPLLWARDLRGGHPSISLQVCTSHPQGGCDTRLGGHTSEVTRCAGAEHGLGPTSGSSPQPCGSPPFPGGPGRRRCQLLLTSVSVKAPLSWVHTTHSTHTYRLPLLWVRNRLRTRGTPRAASVVPAPWFQVCVPGPEGAAPGVSHRVCAGGRHEGLHPGSCGSPCPLLSTADEAHSREPERGMQGRREGEGTLRVDPLPGSYLSLIPTLAA